MKARCLSCLLASLLLLASCGKETPPAEVETVNKITFWHIMGYEGPKEILAAAVERFQVANPDMVVEVQTFANDNYKTKLAIEMASGTPPDVFFTWGGGGLAEYARAGRVVELDGALAQDGWREIFNSRALDICTVDGKTYGVPLDLSAVVLWYNREIFAKYKLAPPKTLEELIATAETLKPARIAPIALGNMKQWPGAFYFIYLAARNGGTAPFLDAVAGKPGASFADPSFVRAGTDLRRMIDAKLFPIGYNGIDVGAARTRFLNERAAMYLMGTWLVARIKTEKPDFLEKLDCVPFPAVADGKGKAGTLVGGVNCGFAISSTCKQPEKAKELLRFLTAPEVASAWCGIGRIPAVKVGAEDEANLPAPTRKVLALIKEAPALQPYYDQYLPPRLAVEHKKTTQGIFAGTMSAEEAARKMDEAAKGKQE